MHIAAVPGHCGGLGRGCRRHPTPGKSRLISHNLILFRLICLPHPVAGLHQVREEVDTERSTCTIASSFRSKTHVFPIRCTYLIWKRSPTSDSMQVHISCSERYLVTHNPSPTFLVDYGQKVLQFDPLQLFNISGTNRQACSLSKVTNYSSQPYEATSAHRTNVVYELNSGQVWVTAFVNDQDSSIAVSVSAGVTTNEQMVPNSGELFMHPMHLRVETQPPTKVNAQVPSWCWSTGSRAMAQRWQPSLSRHSTPPP